MVSEENLFVNEVGIDLLMISTYLDWNLVFLNYELKL